MAQKRFNAKNGISVGGSGTATPIDFIDETGQILSGSRISFLANPTITTDQPLFNGNQTWNSAATPFTGFRINITDAASNVNSKLIDMQIGGISKFNVDKAGNALITGDLTVQGATVTMNTSTVDVEDTNITLGKVATPTDITADGGGITLLGATNKTFNWNSAGINWDSSENINLALGKTYKINNVSVLSNTTLGSSVVTSSLTSLGTITTGVWNGTAVAGQYGGTGVANTGKSITLGGNLTTSGAFNTTLTVTGATNVTLPTTGTLATTGLTAGKAQQVDQTVAATVRAVTTDLTGQSIDGTLSDTGVAITAFHGVAGITYKRKCLGAGDITAGAGLTILQGGASITTAANDTFEVYMLTATTCEVQNYVRAIDIDTAADALAGGHYGQTWQNLTGGRALNTTYTNTTGRPIFVSAILNNAGNDPDVRINVSGVIVVRTSGPASTLFFVGPVVVPSGGTYSITKVTWLGSLNSWSEFR